MIEGIVSFDPRRESRTDLAHARLPGLVEAARARGGFVWVPLVDPDAAELGEFATLLGLHPLAVADAVSGRQQPKIQVYEEHLFVVLWGLTDADRFLDIAIAPTFLFVRDGLLLTVEHHRGDDAGVLATALDGVGAEVEHGVVGALYAVMRRFVEVYTGVADRIETELEALESSVFDEGGP